jgi:hypothetical protein
MTCAISWETAGATVVASDAAAAEEVACALRTVADPQRCGWVSRLLLDLRDIELSGQWEDAAAIVLSLTTKREAPAVQCRVAIVVRTSGVALLGRIGPLWSIAPAHVRPFLNDLEARAWLGEGMAGAIAA